MVSFNHFRTLKLIFMRWLPSRLKELVWALKVYDPLQTQMANFFHQLCDFQDLAVILRKDVQHLINEMQSVKFHHWDPSEVLLEKLFLCFYHYSLVFNAQLQKHCGLFPSCLLLPHDVHLREIVSSSRNLYIDVLFINNPGKMECFR